MHTISFKLKQHTPIIHFHNREGATLRATEVKPKLDKYILDLVFHFEFEKAKYFLIGYDNNREDIIWKKFEKGFKAFDFKIEIKTFKNSVQISEIKNERFPCFFGNMGDEYADHPKFFSITQKPIMVTFITKHINLIEIFKKEIPNFFARNNFGTRLSKGFGSFYIDESDINYEEPALYSFFNSIVPNKDFKLLYQDIEMVHKVIRSGINDKGRNSITLFYMKPLIWKYFQEKEISWEKRRIKKEFYPVQLKSQIDQHFIVNDGLDVQPVSFEGEASFIIKDLMGLSSLEKWKIPYNKTISKMSIDADRIDRFPSPYFFKPIITNGTYRVYIDFEPFNNQFLEKKFSISDGDKSFELGTPEKFDITDFFHWALTEVNILELIGEEYRNTKKADRILHVFEQLGNNII